MTAQLLEFPIADTLDRATLRRAAAVLGVDVDDAASDTALRAAVRAALRSSVTAAQPHGRMPGLGLNPGDLDRITGADYESLRDAAASYCPEPGCVVPADDLARDAVFFLASQLRDAHHAWRPARIDPTGAITAWVHRVAANVTRLIDRTALRAAAVAAAARHNGCAHGDPALAGADLFASLR